jgi:hypothetical protein
MNDLPAIGSGPAFPGAPAEPDGRLIEVGQGWAMGREQPRRRPGPALPRYDRRVIRWAASHPGRSWLSEGFLRDLERGSARGGQDRGRAG